MNLNLHKKIFNQIFTNKFFQNIFNKGFLSGNTIIIFNYIFEKSPHILQEAFVRLAQQPGFSFNWHILLSNKKKIITYVCAKYPQSFEFALSYKWHDTGLRLIETKLNNFYDKKYLYIDIGANHGLRSIYSLSIGRPTILFEPNYFLNDFMLNLFKSNSFRNYKIENLCLSNKEGVAEFYVSSSSYLSSLSKEQALTDKHSGDLKRIEVNLKSLDEYFNGKTIENVPKIIKIDVEGHEYEVIQGAKFIIEKYSPALIVEIFSETKSRINLFEYFFSINYKSFAILNRGRFILVEISKTNYKSPFNSTNYLFTKELEPLKGLKIKYS